MGSFARGLGALALAVFLLGGTFVVPAAAAEGAPGLFFQAPEDGKPGSGANQLNNPRGIASDPASGHFYVADLSNSRIDEFTVWGEFVKAFGWDVVASGPGDDSSPPEDQFEVCVPAAGDVCKAGLEGSGAGQLANPGGLAVDGAGDVYVFDSANFRVQKFDSAGKFLLMLGGEVNETTGENLCTAASGNTCRKGTLGTANGQFDSGEVGAYIAINPAGNLYVGDKERIQEFEPNGTYKSQLPLPEAGTVRALAVDSNTGDVYVALSGQDTIYKLAPATGEVLAELTVKSPKALATDSAGDVYAIVASSEPTDPEEPPAFQVQNEVLEFDSTGKAVKGAGVGDRFAAPPGAVSIFDQPFLTVLGTNSACGLPSDDVYVASFLFEVASYVRAYGPAPLDTEACPPPKKPPSIDEQYALSADSDSAVVRAEINPHFWADTTYYVQYGTAECPASGWSEGCKEQPVAPGSLLSDKVVNSSLPTAGVFLGGLSPATTYHFRFVAKSSGGGPVFGKGGKVGEDGKEATFTTFPLSTTPPSCPNDAFRSGAGAKLPDCRAYEMVSPLDKNGGDIAVLFNILNFPAGLEQSSTEGDKLAYSSATAFGDALSAPYTSQYIASRGEGGWSTHGISPPRAGASVVGFANPKFDVQFKAFTGDLCSGWLLHDTDPALAEGGVEGYLNLYRRQSCGEGADSYEAITTIKPPSTIPNSYWPELQGLSADGSAAVFRANDKLISAAANIADYQLYELADGTLRYLCVLPSGSKASGPCTAGTASSALAEGRYNTVAGAVSEDGSRVFWSLGKSGPGKLYLRANAEQPPSQIVAGKCADPGKACTYPVSELVSSDVARFWAGSPDGTKAIFTIEAGPLAGNLYEFEAEEEGEEGALVTKATLIAEGTKGVMGAGRDLARVYFVSTKALEGDAEAGQPNLYLSEGGVVTFIATLSAADAEQLTPPAILSPVNQEPIKHNARVSPDGRNLAFGSTASLSGYDNHDAESGKADAEIFVYEAGSAAPLCVSCNPSGARPTGRDLLDGVKEKTGRWAAARIPTWANQLYAPRALSENGRRLFFDSFEALVPRDTNGRQDVYEWERAGSKEACEELGADLFVEEAGGCISLISSGEGAIDSDFVDASADGRDAFFTTGASLLPTDPGLVDIYDARAGGGFPLPESPAPPCEGEACQSPPAAPDDPTPASSAFQGEGNVKEGTPPLRCGKGKRKVNRGGKPRCVSKHKSHGKAKAHRHTGGRGR